MGGKFHFFGFSVFLGQISFFFARIKIANNPFFELKALAARFCVKKLSLRWNGKCNSTMDLWHLVYLLNTVINGNLSSERIGIMLTN